MKDIKEHIVKRSGHFKFLILYFTNTFYSTKRGTEWTHGQGQQCDRWRNWTTRFEF